MRLSTLLTVPILATSLVAQSSFSEQQRAEMRQIIREEIRAAIKDLVGKPAAQPATPRRTTLERAGTENQTNKRRASGLVITDSGQGITVDLEGLESRLEAEIETGLKDLPTLLEAEEIEIGGKDSVILHLNRARSEKRPIAEIEAEISERPALEAHVFELHGDKPVELEVLLDKAKIKALHMLEKPIKIEKRNVLKLSPDGEKFEVIDLGDGRAAMIELRNAEQDLKKVRAELEKLKKSVELDAVLKLERIIENAEAIEKNGGEIEVEIEVVPTKPTKKKKSAKKIRRLIR